MSLRHAAAAAVLAGVFQTQGVRERIETLSIAGDMLTIETMRPGVEPGDQPHVQTDVFVRKRGHPAG